MLDSFFVLIKRRLSQTEEWRNCELNIIIKSDDDLFGEHGEKPKILFDVIILDKSLGLLWCITVLDRWLHRNPLGFKWKWSYWSADENLTFSLLSILNFFAAEKVLDPAVDSSNNNKNGDWVQI